MRGNCLASLHVDKIRATLFTILQRHPALESSGTGGQLHLESHMRLACHDALLCGYFTDLKTGSYRIERLVHVLRPAAHCHVIATSLLNVNGPEAISHGAAANMVLVPGRLAPLGRLPIVAMEQRHWLFGRSQTNQN